MRKNVTIREHDYGYKVVAKGEGYGHEQNWYTLGNALQDAHDYLKGEDKMNKLKVNDEVKVANDRWSLELKEGLLITYPLLAGYVWKVAATGLRLPVSKDAHPSFSNNTIIVEKSDKSRVVFISHLYLEVLNVCSKCGARI